MTAHDAAGVPLPLPNPLVGARLFFSSDGLFLQTTDGTTTVTAATIEDAFATMRAQLDPDGTLGIILTLAG